jgi:hypothetical protein
MGTYEMKDDMATENADGSVRATEPALVTRTGIPADGGQAAPDRTDPQAAGAHAPAATAATAAVGDLELVTLEFSFGPPILPELEATTEGTQDTSAA